MWRYARRWWQEYTGEDDTPFDDETPAWAISLVIHAIVFVALGLVGLSTVPKPTSVIVVTPSDEPPPEEPVPEIKVDPQRDDDKSDPGMVSIPSGDPREPDIVIPDDPDSPLPPLPKPLPGLGPDDINKKIRRPNDIKDGVASVEQATGALHFLTPRIIGSIEEQPTLVCWLFDQSLSLASQRAEIADQIERVFEEIAAAAPAKAANLLNVAYGYGERVTCVVKEPTSGARRIEEAIRQLDNDMSGIERTFTAVEQAAKDSQAVRRRLSLRGLRVMIIVFTDEAGDDQDKADAVAHLCRSNEISVFVVGVPAPFGQQVVELKFVEFDPAFARAVHWGDVDQGPESRDPEVVRILMGGPLDEPIDSGFGPFSLCKLCRETSGTYFAVHPDRQHKREVSRKESAAMSAHLRYFFDPDAMREYRPAYEHQNKYHAMLRANTAKAALVEAARATSAQPLAGLASQPLRFMATDQAKLIKDLNRAQEESAKLDWKIDALLQGLEKGEKDRFKIPPSEKRWQAGYDLALGRTLALKARTAGYNTILAEAKGARFKNPRNNTWVVDRVNPQPNRPVDSRIKKTIEKGMELLERVVREHPGTPWALIAAEELRTPLGYSLSEEFTPPPPPVGNTPQSPPRPRPPEDDDPRKLQPPPMRVLPRKI